MLSDSTEKPSLMGLPAAAALPPVPGDDAAEPDGADALALDPLAVLELELQAARVTRASAPAASAGARYGNIERVTEHSFVLGERWTAGHPPGSYASGPAVAAAVSRSTA
jgi:hypothetical protein